MMTFYQSMAPYYDLIFPTNEQAVSLLSSYFKGADTLLDVGAGTGNMAIALTQKNYKVTVIEPEQSMAEQIHLKAVSNRMSISISTTIMQQINTLDKTYDGIYCLGNTLVHLQDLEEIQTFFNDVHQMLNPNGLFIFQIVNYDRVLEKKDFSFPIIKKDTFTFERQYELDGKYVLFTTKLSTDNQTIKTTIPLYPATSRELLPLLKQCGFEVIDTFGNFAQKDYTTNSPAFITIARAMNR